jgi:hypothetical protein
MSDENNGHVPVALSHLLLQIELTEARQPHIEHQATGHIGARAAQELLRRRERLDSQSDRPDQILKSFAQGRIILDDEDQGIGVHQATPSRPIGNVN